MHSPGQILSERAAAWLKGACLAVLLTTTSACALVDAPDGSTPSIPTATPPVARYEGLNEARDPITRVNLGRDILVPQPLRQDVMPDVTVGPYEMRGETLASALQLILDDYDIALAFEANEGLTRRITVANLHGKLKDAVNKVCGLADLYCHFEDDTLTVKKTETFVVDLPPLVDTQSSSSSSNSSSSSSSGSGGDGEEKSSSAYDQLSAGLKAVIGTEPTVDTTTRVMVYTATQRSQKYALQYFERLRKNTALIIFETNIWEVALNNENRTGIEWNALFEKVGGNLTFGLALPGGVPGSSSPITITPAYTGSGNFSTDAVLSFISSRGSVKTISQPQITLLSGSKAAFAVSKKQNFVSGLTRTPPVPPAVTETVSTTTSTVTTGLNMTVTSAWDQSTVYGDVKISLDDLLRLDTFTTSGGNIQLPQTTQRNLQTAIRVRPGDAILIGGLVSEKDNLSDSGPGFMKPLFGTSREVTKTNTELVFLLRPRIVVFNSGSDADTPPVVDAVKDVPPAPPADISDAVKGMFAPSPAAPIAPPSSLPEKIEPRAEPKKENPPVELKKTDVPPLPLPKETVAPAAAPADKKDAVTDGKAVAP